MPELPEVETVCRGISPIMQGQTIIGLQLMRPDLRIPIPVNMPEIATSSTVKRIHRRAKYILIELANVHTIIVHLGMSGKLVAYPHKRNQLHKHDHVIFDMDNGYEIVFNDPRRFGLITHAHNDSLPAHPLFAALGPEPLEATFTGKSLFERIHTKSTPIKTTIMDNAVVVGVGNIYACESLFRSGIHPQRIASSITSKEAEKLAGMIKIVLQEAIESGGSTLRDYVRSSGDSGYFQHHFQVYGREKEPCLTCHTPIERIKQAGRSSFYCSKCQS